MKHILFFIKKVRHQFFNIANRNIIKISNLYFIVRQHLSFDYLGPKDNHYVIHVILLDIQDLISKTHSFELLLVYLFK